MRERLAAIVPASIALATILLGACVGACGAESARDPSVAITPIELGVIVVEHEDGAVRGRRELGQGPLLVHFWATWCVPCRRELPALLAAAREAGVGDRVLAVSTDASWGPVRGFFDGAIPAPVVREPAGAAARALGVSSLPDTYLLDAQGRATRRIAGALDWSRPEHRAWLAATLAAAHER